MCIRDDLREKKFPVSEETVSLVLNELKFFPKSVEHYSKSGCKKVSEKVNYIMEEL